MASTWRYLCFLRKLVIKHGEAGRVDYGWRRPAKVPNAVIDEIRWRERNGVVELPQRPGSFDWLSK